MIYPGAAMREQKNIGVELTAMSGILYDARKVKIYEAVQELCRIAGESGEWADCLWSELLTDGELMEEMVYYLEHHCLKGKMVFEGYTLIDLFVWQMDIYNLIADSGKNTDSCNKETMVLRAFRSMAGMKKDPEHYKKRLSDGFGMDKYL